MGNKKAKKQKDKEVELRHSRIEHTIGIISLVLSAIAIAISIWAINLTKTQMNLEYNQYRPILSMSAEVIQNEDPGTTMLQCEIKNDGGNIREAVITPHLFLTYAHLPNWGADYDGAYAIEIKDLFAPYYENGIYYYSGAAYRPDESNWVFAVNSERLSKAMDLHFLIGDSLRKLDSGMIVSETFAFVIELEYVDILGNRQEEWYNATNYDLYNIIAGEVSDYTPYQLRQIDEHSSISLSVFQSSVGVNIGEEMELVQDEEMIDELAHLCYEGLCEG